MSSCSSCCGFGADVGREPGAVGITGTIGVGPDSLGAFVVGGATVDGSVNGSGAGNGSNGATDDGAATTPGTDDEAADDDRIAGSTNGVTGGAI